MESTYWKAKYEEQVKISESLKRDLAEMQRKHPEPCPNPAHSYSQICTNRFQCWEPCGELGNDERFITVVPAEKLPGGFL